MADEDLRRLERDATTGDPAACVRFAWHLERDGRRGEATRVLQRAFDAPSARQVLAGFPAWTHADADAGGTRYLDVEPVTETPRLLWKAKLADPPFHQELGTRLVASPLGVVCWTTSGFEVLDPRDGSLRWRKDAKPGEHWRPRFEILGGQLLVANESTVERLGLTGGEDLGAVEIPQAGRGLLAGGVLHAPSGTDHFAAHPIAPSGDGEPLWKARVRLAANASVVRVARDLLLLQTVEGLRALDRATGRLRWRSRVFAGDLLADGRGLVRGEVDFPLQLLGAGSPLTIEPPERPEHPGLAFYDLDGRVVHRTASLASPKALTRDLVIVARGDTSAAMARASDAPHAELPFGLGDRSPVAAAREVIFGMHPFAPRPLLGACRSTGELLWALDSTDIPGSAPTDRCYLALNDRVVYLLLGDGTLAALTDL